ncbi:hypothetical protein MNBD_UNCLBAC01-1911 [hydrothermal vent metagenome]|uniref:Uncharacterized protein n=1 Tax=hydrothermal vent metagenome TaxID=652676 RepID=A0A3B1DKT2_9ZZZZ
MRILLEALLFIFILISSPAFAEQMLVQYDFDYENLDVGPDTFHIFQYAGTVSLSQKFFLNGNRSLHIKDVASSGDFSEMQGYFPQVNQGVLYFHFALMTPEPQEEFNVALAGDGHFFLRKDGLGFWLKNENSILTHYTNKKPQELFRMEPYIWYVFDVQYDVDEGLYNLIISDEYGREYVRLEKQINASNEPGASLNKYSFIGDLKDQSNVEYYIDEIRVGFSEEKEILDFVAPGRRKFFVDIWNDYHQKLYGKLQCLAAFTVEDFGIDPYELQIFSLKFIQELVEADSNFDFKKFNKLVGEHQELVFIASWLEGCRDLENEKWDKAIAHFIALTKSKPKSLIYQISLALAYSGKSDFDKVDKIIAQERWKWPDDLRWNIILAMLATRKYNFNDIEKNVIYEATLIPDELQHPVLKVLFEKKFNQSIFQQLEKLYPEEWKGYFEKVIESEQYYFALLWQNYFQYARDYAHKMVRNLKVLGIESIKWMEWEADAAFFQGDYLSAKEAYLKVVEFDPEQKSSYLKLADIYYVMDDKIKEKEVREKFYGYLMDGR